MATVSDEIKTNEQLYQYSQYSNKCADINAGYSPQIYAICHPTLISYMSQTTLLECSNCSNWAYSCVCRTQENVLHMVLLAVTNHLHLIMMDFIISTQMSHLDLALPQVLSIQHYFTLIITVYLLTHLL